MVSRHWQFSIIVMLLAGGCSQNEDVNRQVIAWENKTNAFFEEKKTLENLHSWLREQNVYYTFHNSEVKNGDWAVGLETINVDTFRCERVKVILNVTMNSEGVINTHNVYLDEGACLW